MEQITKRFMNWASILEEKARDQATRTSEMPFVFPHLALMPDAHWGRGATVGSVIPTRGAIIPAAVGVDIGCGMIAQRLDVHYDDLDLSKVDALRDLIAERVPLSPGNYNEGYYNAHTLGRLTDLEDMAASYGFDPKNRSGNWRDQLGSLGGGNHFIEVCKDEEGFIWLFLHSGSRGVGNRIAQHYIKAARKSMERYFIDLPKNEHGKPDWDLSYLVEGDKDFWGYMKELRWAQKFALLNREEMMERVFDSFADWHGDANVEEEINCHHNYTQKEIHWGKEVWLSRKGAIDASYGTLGLIPGSMGAASYVVEGKGNRLALNSSPHGAGRQYGRKAAEKQFNYADLEKRMEGISWMESDGFLDEHPDAYKDIDQVMLDSADLVRKVHTLRQFVNVKGTS